MLVRDRAACVSATDTPLVDEIFHFTVGSMRKLLGFVGTTIGGYIGWWAGSLVGFMSAFVLSMLGTAVGLYFAMRVAREYE